MLTDIKLIDINGEPRIRKDLPSPLRIGDPLKLRFRVTRESGGRHEVLEVIDTVFRVVTVAFDATDRTNQIIAVETAKGRPPVWKSVKKPTEASRKLCPAIFPRTSI